MRVPAEAVDLRVVALQRVQFELQVPQIPEGDGLVGGGGGDDVVAGGVERDAVDGVGVGDDLVRGGGGVGVADVDDLERVVVGDGAKERVVAGVVGDVVDDGGVVGVGAHGGDLGAALGVAGGVPEADGGVLGAGDEVALEVRVPVEAVALLFVADEGHLRETGAGAGGHERVLGAVEDEDVAVGAHGRDEVGLLGHVARLVDLALVHHLLLDVEAALGAAAVAADFLLLLVVAAGVLLGDRVGELDFGDLEVVGVVAGGVGADEEAVGGVVLAGDEIGRAHV